MSVHQNVYLFFLALALLFHPTPNAIDQDHPGNQDRKSRTPASSEEVSCLKLINKFYPEKSHDFLLQQIELNADFHSFYRSFVPLFYKAIKEDSEIKKLDPLKKYVSTIGGDVHSENFGFIIDDNGKIIFSLNDCDDTTEGPLFVDVLRHFISIDIVSKKIDWEDYLKSYERGIREEKNGYSRHTQKKMEKVFEKTQSIMDEYIALNPPSFIKLSKPNRPMTTEEVSSVKNGLLEKFPLIDIFDQYARIKVDGGSAGMKRFYVLARLKPDGPVKWLDIKETTDSSFDKVFSPSGKSIEFEKRFRNLKEDAFDGRLNETLSIVKVQNKPFSLRFKNNFAVGIKLEDVKDDDLKDVLLDEAFALGRFHANSLRSAGFKAEDYLHEWNNISNSDLSEISEKLRDHLKKLYRASK